MDTTTETIETAKATFADAQTRVEGAYGRGQELFGEMSAFGKGNLEAMVESSKIAAKGMETLGQSAAAFMRQSVADAQAHGRALAAAGSPTEFLKLQGDFTRTSFDKLIAETSRGTEAMLKLAADIAQPLSNRAALAAEKMKVAA